jgi:hypothetical protein
MSSPIVEDQAELAQVVAPAVRRHSRRRPARSALLALALLGCLLLALGWLLAPTLRWAYDVERAGALIDRGMAWPTPRTAASLPQVHDEQALAQALQYLADAVRQRPAHPHAYRLTGQIYAARSDWGRAADAYEQARRLAPYNPLYAWEASLVYERMSRAVEQSPHESLFDTIASGHLIAPGQLIKSLFCSDKGAESCYFGRGTYTQPYAAFPEQAAASVPVLFLHPPASVEHSVIVRPERPALSFVVGLDPVARGWRTDGATFRVWVQPANGARQLVTELTLDRATALRGWVPGWANLSRWAGQTVSLELESHPGPAGDLNDDWFGWGGLTFTTIDAARYAAMLPQQRMRQARIGIR